MGAIKLMADYGGAGEGRQHQPGRVALVRTFESPPQPVERYHHRHTQVPGARFRIRYQRRGRRINKEGLELWRLLQVELDASYGVSFQPWLDPRVYKPGEFPEIK